MLIVQGLVFAVIYYFVFDFMIGSSGMKTPGRGDDGDDDRRLPQRSTPRPRPR